MPLTTSGRRWLEHIWDELAQAKVEERRLVHIKGKEVLEGLMEEGTITVNPIPSTIDTLIHELFHRRYPHWPETYVKARTTELIARMTDAEELALWKAYQSKVVRRKKRKLVE